MLFFVDKLSATLKFEYKFSKQRALITTKTKAKYRKV
ncbi:hypothetical protein WwAna0351 [Wolbachia endosymbiont of Drosophila ananassae]|nr:hypothetical protein WwAna0139 [Wolbachia endosymbiont of Drosophila ananassae]EAL58059.1 hypothetical protein WwAna0351 [Wolbachia endosymbiont of Drosophila ananassae]